MPKYLKSSIAGHLSIQQGDDGLYRTGIRYDLIDMIYLIAMDLVTANIIEGASTSICVLGVLEQRHW